MRLLWSIAGNRKRAHSHAGFSRDEFWSPENRKSTVKRVNFFPSGILFFPVAKRKNKIFIQDSIFWRFSILTRRIERRARWCNRRRLQKKSWQKVSSDQYQQLSFLGPSLKRPVGPSRARCVKAIFTIFPIFGLQFVRGTCRFTWTRNPHNRKDPGFRILTRSSPYKPEVRIKKY